MSTRPWLDTVTPWALRAVRVSGAAALMVSLSLAAAACASGGKHPDADQDIHPVVIEIDNNLTIPTELMVYLEQSGVRQQLGTVPGGENKTFQFTPVSYGQPYRLIGVRQLERSIPSQSFTISGPETGTIVWNLQANIIGFYDVLDATSPQAAPPPAPANPPSPPANPPPPSSPQSAR